MPRRDEPDKDTVIVTDGGGGAGLVIALVVVALVVFGGIYAYQTGAFQGGDQVDVRVEAPNPPIQAPEQPATN
jgi:hypothetical protein